MIVDIEQVLDKLQMEYVVKGHEALSLCPMHEQRTGKSDSNPSWWINLETGQNICFSCGYKASLLRLVCDVNEFYVKLWGSSEVSYDYTQARTWLSQVTDLTPEQMLQKVRQVPSFIRQAPKPVPMSDARLSVFVSPPTDALSDRHLSADSAASYGVLWDEKDSRWILPLRHADDLSLMGWQEKGHKDRYFKNRPPGMEKSKTLFGLENQTDEFAVVVESPLDCVRIASAGIDGAVATCGAIVSLEQVKLLRRSERIIVAFDNPKLDAAGKKASDQLLEFGKKYALNLFFFNYGDSGKKDPGDMTDEEIRWGIATAKSSIFGPSAYV
jgi:hypothetical protein